MRVLLIEDENAMARTIERMLKQAGHNVYTTDLGEEGIDLAKLYNYDIIVLDLNLPDVTGHQVLRRLRSAKVETPVLILSGLGDIENKVEGFDLGAADYVAKPFHKQELLARINAVVRRAKGHSDSSIGIGELTVNLDTRTVEVKGKPVRLTGKEFAMVELLALRKGTMVTKEMFLDHLYGDADTPEAKVVDAFMYKVRKKLTDATGGQDYIATSWGRGYMLSEPPDRKAAQEGSDAAEPSSRRSDPTSIHSVLLVEDDVILAMDLAATLTEAGYEVLGPVSTSAEAVEMADALRPDLALVDINLKDGRNAGIDAAREVHSRCGAPCLFLSGQGAEARKNKDAALGLLEKPMSPDAILESIAAIDILIHGKAPPRLPHGLELFQSA